MASDEVVADLLNLGLTQNESKAYKALVALGQSPARKIAEQSGVPRSKVYETLDLLEKRGIARRIQGTDPTEFKPSPPKVAIPYLMEKIEHSSRSAQTALETLEEDREGMQEELVWTVQGTEQITLGLINAISKTKESIFIATRSPKLLSPLRTAFADAKKRKVIIELYTTKFDAERFHEFRHYLTINDEVPTSEVLVERMTEVLSKPNLPAMGWDPDQMSIIVIDNIESIAVFGSSTETQKPWGLHIRNPLIVLFQWQVIKSVIGAIGQLLGR